MVNDITPIPTIPGANPEADAFNLLVAGLDDDWQTMRYIVGEQSRVANERTLACVLCWLCILIGMLPVEVARSYLLHVAGIAEDPAGSPLIQRDLGSSRNAV